MTIINIAYLDGGIGCQESNVSDGHLRGPGSKLVISHEAIHPAKNLLELVHLVLTNLSAGKAHLGIDNVSEGLQEDMIKKMTTVSVGQTVSNDGVKIVLKLDTMLQTSHVAGNRKMRAVSMNMITMDTPLTIMGSVAAFMIFTL